MSEMKIRNAQKLFLFFKKKNISNFQDGTYILEVLSLEGINKQQCKNEQL